MCDFKKQVLNLNIAGISRFRTLSSKEVKHIDTELVASRQIQEGLNFSKTVNHVHLDAENIAQVIGFLSKDIPQPTHGKIKLLEDSGDNGIEAPLGETLEEFAEIYDFSHGNL